jgi:hypothetical protein
MFDVENHGSIVLIRPYTDDVREWLVENTDGTWFGGALAVEPRYVEALVTGLVEEGYALQ